MQRLLGAVSDKWVIFDGWAASHLAGGDSLDFPLDRFLNLVYYWLTRNAEEESVDKFNRRLWIPPTGVTPAPGSPWSAESETAALSAFAAQVNGAVAIAKPGAAAPTG